MTTLDQKLWNAVADNQSELVPGLLAAGARRETRGVSSKRTCLHLAAQEGHLDCLRALLDAGADLEARDEDQWTPLHFAACFGREDCVQALLDAGANCDAKDKDQWTPLHHAANFEHEACVHALLAAGASLDAKTCSGAVPKELSAKKTIRKLLKVKKPHQRRQPSSSDEILVEYNHDDLAKISPQSKFYISRDKLYVLDDGSFLQIGTKFGTKWVIKGQ